MLSLNSSPQISGCTFNQTPTFHIVFPQIIFTVVRFICTRYCQLANLTLIKMVHSFRRWMRLNVLSKLSAFCIDVGAARSKVSDTSWPFFLLCEELSIWPNIFGLYSVCAMQTHVLFRWMIVSMALTWILVSRTTPVMTNIAVLLSGLASNFIHLFRNVLLASLMLHMVCR